jgi:selenium-binding protein 1
MVGPTFCRTLAGVIAALPERLPCVAAFDPAGQAKNAIAVIDADPSCPISAK